MILYNIINVESVTYSKFCVYVQYSINISLGPTGPTGGRFAPGAHGEGHTEKEGGEEMADRNTATRTWDKAARGIDLTKFFTSTYLLLL